MTGDQLVAYYVREGRTLPEIIEAGPIIVGAAGKVESPYPVPASRDLPTESEAAAILAPYTKAQRLADVRQQAVAIIQTNLPQPWEILKDQATPAFIEWADAYLGLVAAELARLEDAINNDEEAIPDWPEVEE